MTNFTEEQEKELFERETFMMNYMDKVNEALKDIAGEVLIMQDWLKGSSDRQDKEIHAFRKYLGSLSEKINKLENNARTYQGKPTIIIE